MSKSKGLVSTAEADRDWQAESDLRAVLDAAAIRKDPKRYAKVQALAAEKVLENAKIAGDTEADGD